jgi:hypothetical protein
VRRFHARVEFRRADRASAWAIAGVVIEHRFWPAAAGVEPVLRRLPEPGLVGWTDLPSPVLAPDEATAAEIAIGLARARWADRATRAIPFAGGGPDRVR